MQLITKTRIDFIGKRKVTFVISGIIAIVGIIGIIQIARNAVNMGIDFSGGDIDTAQFCAADFFGKGTDCPCRQ